MGGAVDRRGALARFGGERFGPRAVRDVTVTNGGWVHICGHRGDTRPTTSAPSAHTAQTQDFAGLDRSSTHLSSGEFAGAYGTASDRRTGGRRS